MTFLKYELGLDILPADTPKQGRPVLPIDGDLIYDMAVRGVKTKRIADFFGCDPSTLEKRFSAVLRKAHMDRMLQTADAQNSILKGGNATMAIWLGKQELDQREPEKTINVNSKTDVDDISFLEYDQDEHD